MLERVALGQTRFSVPGVAVDSRGVVLGKSGLLLFGTLEGIVSWLRLYGDEESFDDLLPGMKVLRLKSAVGSRPLALVIPSASSYVLDRAARCARLAGGQTFTGTTKHFVKYRDERSPQGYDVVDLQPVPPGAEVVLHTEEGSSPFAADGTIDVRGLILRLSLRRVPGSERLDAGARADLLIAAPHGLGPGMLRYLIRARVESRVALVTPQRDSAFAAPEETQGYLLVRVRDLPERILGSLIGVPGIGVFRMATENVGVELGHAHPIQLSSCPSLFPRERFYLFWGEGDRVDAIAGPVEMSAAEHVVDIALPAREKVAQPMGAGKPEPLSTEIRLVPTTNPPRRVVGSLVAHEDLPRLKQLVYTLPPMMLAAHRVAVTERGALLLVREGESIMPLGTILCELAPGLLVPLGMDLVPRVSVEVLKNAMARPGAGELITVFPHEGGPFSIAASDLVALERRAVAKIPVAGAGALPVAVNERPGFPTVLNDEVGRFALWGFKPAPRK